jgi:hypothetical protein
VRRWAELTKLTRVGDVKRGMLGSKMVLEALGVAEILLAHDAKGVFGGCRDRLAHRMKRTT